MYQSTFIARRMVFALIIVIFKNYPSLQIMFFFYQCLLVYMYNIHARPFEEPELNHLELFNEVCILLSAYHLLAFTDWIPSELEYDHIHEGFGISMIAVTAINVIVNTTIMMVKSLKKLKLGLLRLRVRYQRWRQRREL